MPPPAGPEFGALGATFTVARIMQALSLIAIIGMTANFVAQMVSSKQVPPTVLIGTLAVTSTTIVYTVVTWILYYDSLLPFLISSILDSGLMLTLIIVAITIGKPLSYLDCSVLPILPDNTTVSFLDSVGSNMYKVNYFVWAGASKTTCYEMKSIWGLSIALSLLLLFSFVVSLCMWKSVCVAKELAEKAKKKKEEEEEKAKEVKAKEAKEKDLEAQKGGK